MQYGDGLFETLVVRRGRPCGWHAHWQRLALGCERLSIPLPEADPMREEALQVCQGLERGVLKLLLSRGPSARGYRAPMDPRPTRVLSAYVWDGYPEECQRDGVRVRYCDTRALCHGRLGGLKHLNRLAEVMARSEWDDPAIAEGILLNDDNEIVGGTMSNVFAVRDHRLTTPPVTRCGIAGVTRAAILRGAEALGVSPSVEVLTPQDLETADEVFLSNSLMGIWPVRCIGPQTFDAPGVLTQRLQQALTRAPECNP